MTTVRELIQKLKGYDLDCQVLVRVKDDDIYNHVEMNAWSRSNPIIDVAKEGMLEAAFVPACTHIRPNINNKHIDTTTLTVSYDKVIENIMKSNERTMQRNLELNRKRESAKYGN